MAISSFGKILTVLDLFSVSRPIINVDIICEELGLSKPTSYRYLKELVSADLLKRINGTSGDYTLGSKLQFLTIYQNNRPTGSNQHAIYAKYCRAYRTVLFAYLFK